MNLINAAIELTGSIQQAINDADWDRVAQLDQERLKTIDQYFEQTVAVDKNLTLRLKQMNDEIVAQLSAIQQQTRCQLTGIKQASKVSKAYQVNLPS